jgi:hypothetical protein
VIIILDNAKQEGDSSHLAKGVVDDSILCKSYQCSLRQLSDATYETLHCFNCFGCHDVAADPLELETILVGNGSDNGSIPLIVSIDSENNSNTISHCQLMRLSKIVRDFQMQYGDNVLFWFDTICVPPDSMAQDEAQGLALQRMRQTYGLATVVGVLDNWLMFNPATGVDDTELLLKISISVWYQYPSGTVVCGHIKKAL